MIISTEKNRIKRFYFNKFDGKIYRGMYDVPGKKEISHAAIELFFHIGYIPGNKTIYSNIECLPGGCTIETKDCDWHIQKTHYYTKNSEFVDDSFKSLIDKGNELFLKSIGKSFVSNSKVLLPLSGGYDSRAILAGLLEYTTADNIITYSFGTPNTLDYELGKKIAGYAGVKHYSFDLSKVEITQDKLFSIARLTDGNTDLFQPVFLLEILDRFGTDMTVWSGYTGDGIGGSHFYYYNSYERDYVIESFIANSSLKYLDDSDLSREAKSIIEISNSIYKDVLDIHEEVFFANHVERYSASHVVLNNINYSFPFMDDDFVNFFFNLEGKYRKNKFLFNTIWHTKYPHLFSHGLKENYGLTSNSPRTLLKVLKLLDTLASKMILKYSYRQINYIDYSKKIRYDTNFYHLISDCIKLIPDEIMVRYGSQIESALFEHRKGKKNNWRFLTAIASLGIITRAEQ